MTTVMVAGVDGTLEQKLSDYLQSGFDRIVLIGRFSGKTIPRAESHISDLGTSAGQGLTADLVRQRSPLAEWHYLLPALSGEGPLETRVERDMEFINRSIETPVMLIPGVIGQMRRQGRGRICIHAPRAGRDAALADAVRAFWQTWLTRPEFLELNQDSGIVLEWVSASINAA